MVDSIKNNCKVTVTWLKLAASNSYVAGFEPPHYVSGFPGLSFETESRLTNDWVNPMKSFTSFALFTCGANCDHNAGHVNHMPCWPL